MREVCRVGCTLLPHSVDSLSLHKRTFHFTRPLLSSSTPIQTPHTKPVQSSKRTTNKTAPSDEDITKSKTPSHPRVSSIPQPRKGAPTPTVVQRTSVSVKRVVSESVRSTSTTRTTSTIYNKISNSETTAATTKSTSKSTPTPTPTPPTKTTNVSTPPTASINIATTTTSTTSTTSTSTTSVPTVSGKPSIISETTSISVSKSTTISSLPVASTPSVSASKAPSFIAPNPKLVSMVDDTPSSLVPDPSKFTLERLMVTPPQAGTAVANPPVPKGPRFSILQYNVLITQIDVVPQYYYCPEYAQNWDYRGPNLVREMRGYNPDIICMQEVDKFEHFNSSFAQDGYAGIYQPRPYKHLDGLAFFYKKDKFKLIKTHVINYNKIHMPTKDPSAYFLENRFGFINRGKSKYETNNIALVCEMETIEPTPRRLFVATTHIYWNPKMPELKVLQSYTLLKELEKILQVGEKGKTMPPLVITGDFNAMPSSGMYQLYATRKLPHTHADIQSLVLKDLSHNIPISSAYSAFGEPLTNITKGFVGTLDYIWYANTQLALHKVLSPIPPDTYMPNLQFSSDHAALMCELDFLD